MHADAHVVLLDFLLKGSCKPRPSSLKAHPLRSHDAMMAPLMVLKYERFKNRGFPWSQDI